MGLRRWLWDVLSKGDPGPERDPDELVEITVVPLHEGPMLVQRLLDAGIVAEGLPSYDLVTDTLGKVCIMVRRADAAEAEALLR